MFAIGLLCAIPAWIVWAWKKSFFLGLVTWLFCMFQAFMLFGLATAIPVNMVVFPELFVGFVIFWTWWCFGRKPTTYRPEPKIPYVKAPTNPNEPIYFFGGDKYETRISYPPHPTTQAEWDAWEKANPLTLKKP